MLRRYIKCEYRHWSTAPWFYTVVFSVVYVLIGLSNGDEFTDWRVISFFALPLLIVLATMVSAVYWTIEQSLGAMHSSLSMPVTRRYYLRSKYVSVFLAQVFMALFVILITILSYHTRYIETFLNIFISISVALLCVAFISALNFYFALKGRWHAIYIASGASALLYHALYYGLSERYVFSFSIPLVVTMTASVILSVAIAFALWFYVRRVFISQKDLL